MFWIIKLVVDLQSRGKVISFEERLVREKNLSATMAFFLFIAAAWFAPIAELFFWTALLSGLSAFSVFLMVRTDPGHGYSHPLRYVSEPLFIASIACFFYQIAIYIEQLLVN